MESLGRLGTGSGTWNVFRQVGRLQPPERPLFREDEDRHLRLVAAAAADSVKIMRSKYSIPVAITCEKDYIWFTRRCSSELCLCIAHARIPGYPDFVGCSATERRAVLLFFHSHRGLFRLNRVDLQSPIGLSSNEARQTDEALRARRSSGYRYGQDSVENDRPVPPARFRESQGAQSNRVSRCRTIDGWFVEAMPWTHSAEWRVG